MIGSLANQLYGLVACDCPKNEEIGRSKEETVDEIVEEDLDLAPISSQPKIPNNNANADNDDDEYPLFIKLDDNTELSPDNGKTSKSSGDL